MGRLNGKTAFITGAGSGIGRSSALLFAREGARAGNEGCLASDASSYITGAEFVVDGGVALGRGGR